MCIRDRHNRELYERFKDLPIVQLIQINRLRWAGPVQRMAEDRIPKKIMNYLPMGMGRRRRGRPRRRWLDQVGKEAVRLGAANWWTLAGSRDQWGPLLLEARARTGL